MTVGFTFQVIFPTFFSLSLNNQDLISAFVALLLLQIFLVPKLKRISTFFIATVSSLAKPIVLLKSLYSASVISVFPRTFLRTNDFFDHN